MAVDTCLRVLMAQTIYVARLSSTLSGVHGGQSWATPEPVLARVEPLRKVFHDASGNDVISEFFILTEFRIGLNDRVWLPGDGTTTGRGRQPKRVFAPPDEDGTVSHYEVYV